MNDTRQQQQQQQQTQQLPTETNSSTTNGLPTARPSQRRFATMDGNCPVCLNPFQLPIETNCGHLFCGKSFITRFGCLVLKL